MVVLDNNGAANSNQFAKTICSICFEDLKPLAEDLQSISLCGHVFHELCLQQWFEYCPNVKKRSCPICKQTCTNKNVGRLYFQSVSEHNESGLSQKPRECDESPEELRREVKRLEGKVVAMASSFEQQQKEVKEVKDELLSCKDQLKTEAALKKQAITQMAASQRLLRIKSAELDESTMERMRLQERRMALAKELASFKLVSDLDLEEDAITKLASFGNNAGSKETVDVLRKSLVMRNKSYKELMTKCNILGRGEARCLQKLEKANDKIKRLKLRVQELETSFEIKENESLRVLKDQDIKFKMGSHENKMMSSPLKPSIRKSTLDNNLPGFCRDDQDKQEKSHLLNKEENIMSSTFVRGSDRNVITKEYPVPIKNGCFDAQSAVEKLNYGNKDGVSCSGSMEKRRKTGHDSKAPTDLDDDDFVCYGDTNPVQTSLHIRNEIQSPTPASGTGEHCFSGGLLGSDGTNYHLGKWCKKAANGSNARSGDLIAVGADGRGGQIKVMRPHVQLSLDTKDTSSWGKKSKLSNKPNKVQSAGHLKIEHFFQKTGQ